MNEFNAQAAAAQAFNAGNAVFRQNDWTQAQALYEQALQHDALMVPAWLQKARALVRQGELMAAREAFAQTLRLDAANYSAWLEAGHLCRQMGELGQASAAYQRAIDVAPQRHEALLGMARVMMQLGELDAAQRAAADAIRAAARVAEDASNRQRQTAQLLGQYWMEVGQPALALTCLQAALAVPGADDDQLAELCMDAAMAHWRLGQVAQTHALLTRASAAQALPTLSRLALLSLQHNFVSEAAQVMARATELYPQDPLAWSNLAHVHAESWQLQLAEQALDKALSLGEVPAELSLRAAIAGKQGDADAARALYRQLAAQEDPPGAMASSAAMSALYSDQLSAADVAALHRELFAPLGRQARSRESFVREPLAGRRLRLGLVTADLHYQHPVNIFMQPILREIDRSRFEVFVYFTGVSQDAQTVQASQRVEHWVTAGSLNDLQLARRIDTDRIDVLVDLSGHTTHNRMAMFASRAAPVQMSYLGYPGSTGVPHIDWLIGDAVVTPPEDDALCSERVARLPGTVFCYAPEEDYPLPAFGPDMAKRPLTFGSFNNVPKLTPHTLALWARVLQAVPDARLLLKAPSFGDEAAVAFYRQRLEALGVSADRVEFRGPVGLPVMMAEYADVDIALDPVPYNGGTTSLQAMWMGVPVITLHGQSFVSRMGASFMQAAGLPEWVAHSDDDYVAIAQRMATDRQALLTLKAGLRARLQAQPAWDPVQHTRAFEAAILSTIS